MSLRLILTILNSYRGHMLGKIPNVLLIIIFLLSSISCKLGTTSLDLNNELPNNSIESQNIEEVIAATRPNHEIYWVTKKGENFIEYYLSDQNHECAFNAFGTTRGEAITAIRQKINDSSAEHHKTIRGLVARAIKYDAQNHNLMTRIFSKIPDSRSFNDPTIQNKYLDYYAQPTTMIECAVNYDANGNRLHNDHIHYTLLEPV